MINRSLEVIHFARVFFLAVTMSALQPIISSQIFVFISFIETLRFLLAE